MIALQFSRLLSEWRSRAEVWPGSWGLVYWSGCCSELIVDYAYLCGNAPQEMQLD